MPNRIFFSAGCVCKVIFLSSVAVAAATRPTSQPTDSDLPPMAVRRLGDVRYACEGKTASFSADNHRLAVSGKMLHVMDVKTGSELTSFSRPDYVPVGAAYIGEHRLMVAWTGMNLPTLIDVLDDRTGDAVRSLTARTTGLLTDFAVAPDGSAFAISADQNLLCDGRTGEVRKDFGLGELPHAMWYDGPRFGFSADGTVLAVVGFDSQAMIVDAKTGAEKLQKHFEATGGAVLSASGWLLATVHADRQLRLYDLKTGEELAVPEAEIKPGDPGYPARDHGAVSSFAFSGAGEDLVVSKTPLRWITIQDTSQRPLAPPKRILDLKPEIVDRMTWSRDGSLIAVAEAEGHRVIVDARAGKVQSTRSIAMAAISAMSVSPSGNELLAGTETGEVYRWDLEHGALLARRDHDTVTDLQFGEVASLAHSEDGRVVHVSGPADVRVCDSVTLQNVYSPPPKAVIGLARRLAFVTPDGRFCLSAADVDLTMTEIATGQSSVLIHMDRNDPSFKQWRLPQPAACSPDGKLLAVVSREGLRFVDTEARRLGPLARTHPVGTTPETESTESVFSSDGKWAMVLSWNQAGLFESRQLVDPAASDAAAAAEKALRPTAQVIILPNRLTDPLPHVEPAWTLPVHLQSAKAGFSHCGELVAVVSRDVDASVTVLETRSGSVLTTITEPTGHADIPTFVPGKPLLATSLTDGTILLWDLLSAIRSGKGQSVTKDRTNAQLWSNLSADDASVAYCSGLELYHRGHLLDHAAGVSAFPSVAADSGNVARKWVSDLSSQKPADREKAHKALEAMGAAAGSEVRAALDKHPGGEIEARLASIAEVIGAKEDKVDASEKPIKVPDREADRREMLTSRFVQLLEWSTDPRSKAEYERLTAIATPTPPTTRR